MTRPPQHRGDAPIIFVSADDPAWNNKRVNDELRPLKGAELSAHIVGAYLRGETRGDITAPDHMGRTLGDYLDGSETRIELKRLKILDVARFRDLSKHMGQLGAAHAAYPGDVDELVEKHGAAFVFELGEFALLCSEAPRPGESKRSDS